MTASFKKVGTDFMTDDLTPSPSSDATAATFATRAIHVGQQPDPTTGAVIPPIYLTSTFQQDEVGNLRAGYEYSRCGNPTRDSLSSVLADLEHGEHAFIYPSGLAAIDNVLRIVLHPGDTIVSGVDVYGGTHRLIDQVWAAWGIHHVTVDTTDLDATRTILENTHPKLVWIETPSNPLLNITDLTAIAELTHAAGALLAIDNTFATPALQRPIEFGTDIVVHSTTKYLSGHSDIIGGAVVLADDSLLEPFAFVQNAAGSVGAPFDSWLSRRSVKTLTVRVERHSANAQLVAEALVGHPAVAQVLYPGLPDHPGHRIAQRQMSAFGGVVSLVLRGPESTAKTFSESTELFTLAESLGGVESLIEYPYGMTHAATADTDLAVPKTLVRLSVGIESVDDILADLTQALERAQR